MTRPFGDPQFSSKMCEICCQRLRSRSQCIQLAGFKIEKHLFLLFFQEPPPPKSTFKCNQGDLGLVVTHLQRSVSNECVRYLQIQVMAEEASSQWVNRFWCTMLHCLVCFRKAGALFPFFQTKCNTIEQSHMNLLCLIGLLAGL